MTTPSWVLIIVACIAATGTALGGIGAALVNAHRTGRVEGKVEEMDERLRERKRDVDSLRERMDELVGRDD